LRLRDIRDGFHTLLSIPAVYRFSRRYRRALELQATGQNREALAIARDDFTNLTSPAVDRTNPAILLLALQNADLVDQLSESLADPETSRDVLSAALAMCEEVVRTEPALSRWSELPSFRSRFQARLLALNGGSKTGGPAMGV
jgi:hypothetical protein